MRYLGRPALRFETTAGFFAWKFPGIATADPLRARRRPDGARLDPPVRRSGGRGDHQSATGPSADGDISVIEPVLARKTSQPGSRAPRSSVCRSMTACLSGLTVADSGGGALGPADRRTRPADSRVATVRPCVIGIARPAGRPPVAVTFDTDQVMRLWGLPGGIRSLEFPREPGTSGR